MDLETAIEKVWRTEIKKAYKNQILCSERQLQAEFYCGLKPFSKKKNYRVWIEPVLVFGYKKKMIIKPDLIITKGRTVNAVIELKYRPYGLVDFKTDIEKMRELQHYKKSFPLLTDVRSGNYTKDEFKVSNNLLCVYAAIAKGGHAAAVKDRKYWKENYEIKLPEPFLHLVGRIYRDRKCDFANPDKP